MPDLRTVEANYSTPKETHLWLARLHTLLNEIGSPVDAISLTLDVNRLGTPLNGNAIQSITAIAYRALATAEAMAPSAVQGSFIPVGNSLDVFAAVGKVLVQAEADVLIVDPYMDATAVTDFAPLVKEGISIRLLSDSGSVKASLRPAVERWISQYEHGRPLEAKLTPARALHDRLILIDQSRAWVLTQSLKDFAVRSPGSIGAADAETSGLKVQAYEELWRASSAI